MIETFVLTEENIYDIFTRWGDALKEGEADLSDMEPEDVVKARTDYFITLAGELEDDRHNK